MLAFGQLSWISLQYLKLNQKTICISYLRVFKMCENALKCDFQLSLDLIEFEPLALRQHSKKSAKAKATHSTVCIEALACLIRIFWLPQLTDETNGNDCQIYIKKVQIYRYSRLIVLFICNKQNHPPQSQLLISQISHLNDLILILIISITSFGTKGQQWNQPWSS